MSPNFRTFIALLLVLPFITIAANAQVINEFQASNSQTIADEDGDFEDWIELFNETTNPINLGGYGLSDDYDRPYRWVFPDISLQPGQFLLVWASGKNRSVAGSPLHTNFKISASGEELLLTTPDGIRVDEIEPLAVPTDISYGRKPNGSNTFRYFASPTPGGSNSTTGYEGIATAPEFSHPGGLYVNLITLEMTSNQGATIRYTSNGNAPTQNSGQVYSSPLSIFYSGIIRARAFKENYIPSEVSTFQFVRMNPDMQNFSSDIPIIVMNQFMFQVQPGNRTAVSLYFLEGENGSRTNLGEDMVLQSRAMANIRGSSSQSFPKKMFSFHLVDEANQNRHEELFGLPADHNWILNAPYSDKSLMRNVVSYSLAESFGWYAPRTRFVELFNHFGSDPLTLSNYHGLYVLVERIRWSDDRVNITKLRPSDNSGSDITGGYIIKKDRLNDGESGITTNFGTTLGLVRPQEDVITNEQKNWIRQYMSDFESALYSPTFFDPATGYQAYINTDSFIDHLIVTELLKEIDGYRLSTFMYKDRNGKLVMGPVWDFNLSLGNANYINGWKPEGWYYQDLAQETNCFIGCGVRDWYLRLLQDPGFVQKLQYRWWELRQDLINDENLSALIVENRDIIQEAQEKNFQRWPVLGQYIWPNYFVANTWQEELDWMENFLLTRANWIDTQMGEAPVFEEYHVHSFWHFTGDMPNNTPLENLDATYPSDTGTFIEFQSALDGYPFTSNHPNWRKASMERRNRPTAINFSEEGNNGNPYNGSVMRGMQVRQPFVGDAGENTLIFHFDTANYGGLRFSFAAMDEGAADRLIIDYAVNSGNSEWITTGLNQSVFTLTSSFQRYEVNFLDISETDFNSNFKIRVRFDGDNLNQDSGDRVTFNNIMLEYQLTTTSAQNPDEQIPQQVSLNQNYPNPFNPTTNIGFSLPEAGDVRLDVYNVMGQRVATVVNTYKNAGNHTILFDASYLASGVYMYRLQSAGISLTKKMTLVK